ncbi:hypothetical protein VIGAN_01117800 [Vigna angularis var. angularis]|uniref:Uncharacterized protein n=1 Tax=Vigna angularis var. angularis TaxID=157739 RepID=A0A0S3QZC0_PHAAN|nr:hypothetical protein VIGAN_01117800 [Vigna angularis var. angularis]
MLLEQQSHVVVSMYLLKYILSTTYSTNINLLSPERPHYSLHDWLLCKRILNAPTRPSVTGNVNLYIPPITFTQKRLNKFRIMTPMI